MLSGDQLGIAERLLWSEQIDKLVDCHQHLSEFGSAAGAAVPDGRPVSRIAL
jgi:hypothetical protein